MKERPIIFSAPMVRAILDGRKTQTRRVAKIPLAAKSAFYDDECDSHCWSMEDDGMADPRAKMIRNPYGERGDLLWVKETHKANGTMGGPRITYRADDSKRWFDKAPDDSPLWLADDNSWRPSIYMPCWASRITLEIEHVRIERVQDICEEDAKAEGCDGSGPVGSIRASIEMGKERYEYANLWDFINAKRGFCWDSNPWVWVIEFKPVTAF